MKKINRYIVLASAVFALTSCGEKTLEDKKEELKEAQLELATLQSKINKLEKEIQDESKEEVEVDLKPITIFKIEKDTFKHYVEVPGDVTSDKNVIVSPEMSGVVVKRYVEEGQYIRRGQAIASLDMSILNKQIEEVETSLELAKSLFDKQQALWDQKIGSEVQYLQAKNAYESLDSKLASLNEQKTKGTIVSPISGSIDEIIVKDGEMAMAGAPFARVVNINKIHVEAEVSEAYSTNIKRGDIVRVKFPLLEMEEDLKVDLVGKTINPVNRTFKIRTTLQNKNQHLKPNTMAVVKINDFTALDAVSIPSNLVQKNTEGETFLYVVEKQNGKDIIKKVNIETGKTYKGMTMITKGLADGQRAVNKGYTEVIDGEEVKIVM